jgi:beta-catenin-like protein 1
MVRSGIVSLLVGLLSHENVDIVIDAVEVFHELTDEDVGDEGYESEQEANQPPLKILIEALASQVPLEASHNDMTPSGRTLGTRIARGQPFSTK